jgi:hypothetical protein
MTFTSGCPQPFSFPIRIYDTRARFFNPESIVLPRLSADLATDLEFQHTAHPAKIRCSDAIPVTEVVHQGFARRLY